MILTDFPGENSTNTLSNHMAEVPTIRCPEWGFEVSSPFLNSILLNELKQIFTAGRS